MMSIQPRANFQNLSHAFFNFFKSGFAGWGLTTGVLVVFGLGVVFGFGLGLGVDVAFVFSLGHPILNGFMIGLHK